MFFHQIFEIEVIIFYHGPTHRLMVDDLEPERQYQFWVTAVTNAGEGMRSDIVVQTPSKRGN